MQYPILTQAIINKPPRHNFFSSSEATFSGHTTASTTSNAIASPTGTASGSTMAEKLVEDNTTAVHYATRSTTAYPGWGAVYAGDISTWSIFLQPAERTFARLHYHDGFATAAEVDFDLTTGTIGTRSGPVFNAGVIPSELGFTRVFISTHCSRSNAGTMVCRLYLMTADNTTSYLGDGVSGLYYWGNQVNRRGLPGPYVPFTTAVSSIPIWG